MSWSELQRLVEEAESDRELRRGLRRCRSGRELLMACQRLGYRIQSVDLRHARALDGRERSGITPSRRWCGSAIRQAGGGG
ncbi:MAG: Nif11-like leader peptide family natural product precursor [Cyanobacteriota bacterium]|nr:Nif11-like leader peptide family natural product precursor [Cyanobacteriota bacterium]